MQIQLKTGRIIEMSLKKETEGYETYRTGRVITKYSKERNSAFIIYADKKRKTFAQIKEHEAEAIRLISEFKRILLLKVGPANFCMQELGGTGKASKGTTAYKPCGTPLWWTAEKEPIEVRRIHEHDPLHKPGEVIYKRKSLFSPELKAYLIDKGYYTRCNECQSNKNERCEKECHNPQHYSSVPLFMKRKETTI